MKKKMISVLLAAAVSFASVLPVGAAGSLSLPVVEDGGAKYYDVSSKANLKTAAHYCRDNFLENLNICYKRGKRDWDEAYGSNVVNFFAYNTKGFFTYLDYSTNTVCAACYDDGKGEYVFGELELQYLDSKEELAKADAKIQSVLSSISSKSTPDKLLLIADYVCKNAEAGFVKMPDGGYDAINGVYDVLHGVRTNTVCTSYALTFQRFMEKAGIDSYILANGVHAWNVVKLGGKWYGVDCTFGDQGSSMDKSYFLMGKSTMRQYHVADLDALGIFAKSHTVAANNYGTSNPSQSSSAATPARPGGSSKPSASGSTGGASSVGGSSVNTSQGSAVLASGGSSESQQAAQPDDALVVDLSRDTTVGREILEQAMREGKPLELNGSGYSWRFSGEAFTDAGTLPEALNAAILLQDEMKEEDRETLGGLVEGKPYFGFRFSHHGALPGKAEVTLRLGGKYAGKTVSLYSVSDDGKAVPEAEGVVTADGQFSFTTDHCSLWFLTEKESPAGEAPGSSAWLWIVLPVALILVAAAVVGGWFFHHKKTFGTVSSQR